MRQHPSDACQLIGSAIPEPVIKQLTHRESAAHIAREVVAGEVVAREVVALERVITGLVAHRTISHWKVHPIAGSCRWRWLLVLVVLCWSFTPRYLTANNDESLSRFEYSAPAMGTEIQMVVYSPDQATAEKIIEAGCDEIDRLTTILSNYDSTSEISRLCNSPIGQSVQISNDLGNVLRESARWFEVSQSKFDITIGPLTQIWRASRKTKQLPNTVEIERALAQTGWDHLSIERLPDSAANETTTSVTLLRDGMMLDISGIATGYIIDAAFERMQKTGGRSMLINIGGDIRLGDAPPEQSGWKVQIAGLGKSSPALCNLILKNCAVTTSGDLNQFVEIDGNRYSHFIDPFDGMPIQRRQSVTAIAETTLDADAGATALAVMGMDAASELFSTMPLTEAIITQLDPQTQTVRFRRLTQ